MAYWKNDRAPKTVTGPNLYTGIQAMLANSMANTAGNNWLLIMFVAATAIKS